jgi:hypothetical protein
MIANHLKDMYKFAYTSEQKFDAQYGKIYKVNGKAEGLGDKFVQELGVNEFVMHDTEGQDIDYKSMKEGWSSYARYRTFSAGLVFTYESVKGAVKIKNMLDRASKLWGSEYARAKETYAARPFNEGGNLAGDVVFNGTHTGNSDPSGNLLYDSKPLFNLTGNKSTTKGGGEYYNSDASAYSAGAITATHFATLYNLMTAVNNRDELDKPRMNKPNMVLCKPGADYNSIWTVLESDQLAGSPNNDKNPYKGRIPTILAWDYLNEAAWYIGKAQDDLVTFDECGGLEIDMFRKQENKSYCANAIGRFGVHFLPESRRNWVRGGGTSA